MQSQVYRYKDYFREHFVYLVPEFASPLNNLFHAQIPARSLFLSIHAIYLQGYALCTAEVSPYISQILLDLFHYDGFSSNVCKQLELFDKFSYGCPNEIKDLFRVDEILLVLHSASNPPDYDSLK